jgi:sulfite dehydrogenase (cytochrome) subunit B
MRRAPALVVTLAAIVTGAAGARAVLAGEETLKLKDGAARDLTAGRCAICHSLDYIPGNAPVMDRAAWTKTVQKMRERYGAPISDEEAQEILDYLAGNYADKH